MVIYLGLNRARFFIFAPVLKLLGINYNTNISRKSHNLFINMLKA